MQTELHEIQRARWPKSGRHILAQFDRESVIVYQAYRAEIGHFAAKNQRCGAGFSLSRMSWVKPNFLWMMYRSSWGAAENQEVVLAITLRREWFVAILRAAVPSTFWRERFSDEASYKRALTTSDVRLQWDPDHDPAGAPLERRAVQLGLRGHFLEEFARGHEGNAVTQIEDVSSFVAEQRTKKNSGDLLTPTEDVFPIEDARLRESIRLDAV